MNQRGIFLNRGDVVVEIGLVNDLVSDRRRGRVIRGGVVSLAEKVGADPDGFSLELPVRKGRIHVVSQERLLEVWVLEADRHDHVL